MAPVEDFEVVAGHGIRGRVGGKRVLLGNRRLMGAVGIDYAQAEAEMLPVAALGLLNPIIAAAAMAMSSLSVIVNSAALKRLRLSRDQPSGAHPRRARNMRWDEAPIHDSRRNRCDVDS